jgi:hypothetical protein
MRSLRTLITSLLALFCLSACTTVQSQSDFIGLGNLRSGESVVILSNPESTQDFNDNDVDNCIGSIMRHANPELHFVSARRFRENLYPYFMPSTTPDTLEGYKSVLDKPEVQQRIAILGVRYLVIFTKSGTKTDWHGGIFCGAAMGGGGCLGLSWWDRESQIGLVVWDLQDRSLLGNMEAKAAGTGIMPAFFLPIPVYAPATKSAVCRDIGTRLAKLLSGQQQ